MTFPAGSRILAEDLLLIDTPVTGNWSTWSPTHTNITVGNGVVLARYKQIGKTVFYRWKFTLGTTSAIGTSPRFTLPVTPASDTAAMPLGDAYLLNTASENYRGQVRLNSGSTAEFIYYLQSNIRAADVTATAPFTWGSTDVISATGFYEAA